MSVHTADHDPVLEYERCEVCGEALRRAFNQLADMDLGPRDADTLVKALRRAAAGLTVTPVWRP